MLQICCAVSPYLADALMQPFNLCLHQGGRESTLGLRSSVVAREAVDDMIPKYLVVFLASIVLTTQAQRNTHSITWGSSLRFTALTRPLHS